MYKSKEIRWFTGEVNNAIVKWFSIRGKVFSGTTPRTDFYLPFPADENLSIKIREGNIEIKRRRKAGTPFNLSANAAGYLEEWEKWSFEIDRPDKTAGEIIRGRDDDWIRIDKERLGVKIELGEEGEWIIHDIHSELDSGCQLEYTRLGVRGKRWYTFAAEWFGEKNIDLEKRRIEEITGSYPFQISASFSYNAFITRMLVE